MRRLRSALILLSQIPLLLSAQTSQLSPSKLSAAASSTAAVTYERMPLSFEANQGQTVDGVRFLSRGSSATVFFRQDEAVLSLTNNSVDHGAPKGQGQQSLQITAADTVHMQFSGMRSDVQVMGVDKLPGTTNYLTGSNEERWHTNIPTYAQVRYSNIYRGVDLLFHGDHQRLEYDFVVAPGADPDQIRMHFAGARNLALNAAGDLVITAEHGSIAFHRPVVYQDEQGRRNTVSGTFRLLAQNTVGFTLGAYDKKRPVVIDPVLVYSTYIAAGSKVLVAADPNGGVYVAGFIGIVPFPVTQGAFDTTQPATGQGGAVPPAIFVSKLNAAGTALVYSTFITGTQPNFRFVYNAYLGVDRQGRALLTGNTNDPTFPVTANAYQPTCSSTTPPSCGLNNAFLTELNPSGSTLVYSTFLGANTGDTLGTGVAADAAGNLYVAGTTNATNFPVLRAFQKKVGDANGLCQSFGSDFGDMFLAKFNPKATGAASLLYATYLGGSGTETGVNTLAVDANGAAYITGFTNSTDFPVTNSAYQTQCGLDGNCNSNACLGEVPFLTKIDTTKKAAASLAYSTFLSGSGLAQGQGVAADDNGNAYLTGYTLSSDFPTTNGVIAACHVGQSTDSFVAKINTANSGSSSLAYSTCLGDLSGGALTNGIAVDSAGSAYVVGTLLTPQTQYPSVSPVQKATNSFLSKLAPDASAFVWSTRFGAVTAGSPAFITLGTSNDVLIGYTSSDPQTPTSAGSYNPLCNPQAAVCDLEDSAITVERISQADGAFATINPLNAEFPETEVGHAAPVQKIALRDVGNQPYVIHSITLNSPTPSEFNVTDNCPIGSFGPASLCTLTVHFTPQETGAHKATLVVNDSAPGSPHTVSLTGQADMVEISPATLTFPATAVGTVSAPQTITVTNVATTRTLSLTPPTVTAGFQVSANCVYKMTPNATCTFSVTFNPTKAGQKTGTLKFTDQDFNGNSFKQTVTLTGTAQ
jgi:hypothetical protein